MSIYEYDEEAVLAAIREESEEIGRKRGEEIGRKRGKEMTTIELACKKLKKGMPVKEIADLLEEDEIRIQLIADAARKVTPPYDAEAVYEEITKVQV